MTFGADTAAAANIRLVDIAMDADGSDVTVETDGGPVRFRLKAPGRHMAMNALAAIGAANATVSPSWPRLTQPSTPDSPSADGRIKSRRHADKAAPEQNTPPPLVGGGSGEGVEQEDVCVSTPPPAPPTRGGVFLGSAQRPYPDAYGDNPRRDASVVHALGTFAPVSGRGTRRPIALPGGTALLLDESYNGNGASIRAALEVLRLQPSRRRIAVLGDMLELGDAGPPEHAALAIEAATAADLVFACGPLMRHLFDALPSHRRGAHATEFSRTRATGRPSRCPGRRDPGEGQPRQPYAARGRGPRFRRYPHGGGSGLMLYNLARPFAEQFILFNLFRYITFRSGAACLTALVVSFWMGPRVIRWLKTVQRQGQPIRIDGPERHLIEKKGTPTMGGLLILFALTISTLLWVDLTNLYVWAVLFVTWATACSASPTTT